VGGLGFRSPNFWSSPCSRSASGRAVGSLVALVAFVLVAMVQRIGIPWYFITHLGLDNGIGG
jgi:hypothetical protein